MGFISGQIDALDQAKISRHDITGGEGDEIALDKRLGLDGIADAISDYLALGRGEGVERLNSLLSAVILNETVVDLD